MSQAQLGQQLGELGYPMEQPTVYKLEGGTRPLRLNEVVALATVFGVEVTDLLRADLNEEERREALHALLDANNRRAHAEAALAVARERLESTTHDVQTLSAEVAAAAAAASAASDRLNGLQRAARDDA